MKLLTAAQRIQMLKNGQVSREREIDHRPVVKLFTPDANATWLLTELDQEWLATIRTLRLKLIVDAGHRRTPTEPSVCAISD